MNQEVWEQQALSPQFHGYERIKTRITCGLPFTLFIFPFNYPKITRNQGQLKTCGEHIPYATEDVHR